MLSRKFTKYDFTQFLNCPEELWLQWNEPKLKPPLTDDDLHNIEQGNLVDSLAQQLFQDEQFLQTLGIKKEQVEFQKRVETDDLVCVADVIIYLKEENEIWLLEVKAAGRVKDELLNDILFQKIVFEKLGYRVVKSSLVHVNKEYVLDGTLDLPNLLSLKDTTPIINAKMEWAKGQIKEAMKFIQGDEPPARIPFGCRNKYDCPFFKRHFANLPQYSVFNISRLHKKKLQQLVDLNIFDIKDIPEHFEVSKNQQLQIDVTKNNEVRIDKDKIRKIIGGLEYPIYFYDYESFSYAVPTQDKVFPYQQMVFQYSLHVLKSKDSELEHFEYLLRTKDESVENLIKSLASNIDTSNGTAIVWHDSFEKGRNREMAKMFPVYREFFEELNHMTYDLENIFKNKLYVHRDFLGLSSIKKILPVLAPEYDYSSLEISNGKIATVKWHHMTDGRFQESEIAKIYQDLLEYCKLDTLAMDSIFNVLKDV